jgi:hypothetical protein
MQVKQFLTQYYDVREFRLILHWENLVWYDGFTSEIKQLEFNEVLKIAKNVFWKVVLF